MNCSKQKEKAEVDVRAFEMLPSTLPSTLFAIAKRKVNLRVWLICELESIATWRCTENTHEKNRHRTNVAKIFLEITLI